MSENNLECIKTMLQVSTGYSDEVIEATLIKYISNNVMNEIYFNDEFAEYERKVNVELLESFQNISVPIDIEIIIEFFEALLETENITENGIVFTPRYISDYIVANTISENTPNPHIIDPGCGCGIFLISAAEFLHEMLGLTYVDIINKYIYGIDLDPNNVRRCKIVLNLFAFIQGENNEKLKPNIVCTDSLKTDWKQLFNVDFFDYVIGNPPYVNTHDMTKETARFLKETFRTTKKGVYNIFYAFIEHAMKFLAFTGKLSYIVPNNFLTIKSAMDLRLFLAENLYLERIIDFADNMVFKPVRTYNCIIRLSKGVNDKVEYCVLDKCEDIKNYLHNDISFSLLDVDKLDLNGWKLVDKKTLSNLQKIESQHFSICQSIRTGIATLRDEIYTVDFDGNNYYKFVNNKKYIIESAVVKCLYKIPDLKKSDNISEQCRYIIFPYEKHENGFEIIPEQKLQSSLPLTYQYLLSRKEELDTRDKGKRNPVAWYAYGRTQGLNKYGRKLLFPTFAGAPRFTLVEDENALFCNGYAIFEDSFYDLSFLAKILNSEIMNYYIKNTSYMIEGGYYCYQKKYIEKFSVPYFSSDEIRLIETMDAEQLNNFLFEKYEIIV